MSYIILHILEQQQSLSHDHFVQLIKCGILYYMQ